MLSPTKFYPESWRLRIALRKAYRSDWRLIKEAMRKGQNGLALQKLKHQLQFENEIMEDELTQIETRQLCRKAHRYGIVVPYQYSHPELWEESRSIGGWQLNEEGFARLRGDIRRERNDRWQFWELRLRVLTALAAALAGAFGAAIGLIATWRK